MVVKEKRDIGKDELMTFAVFVKGVWSDVTIWHFWS